MNTARQLVEIFHLLFLSHLEKNIDKKCYALKGGCNLRFFFKSIRYSEDIDFDVQTIAKDTLQRKIDKILNSPTLTQNLKNKGLEILQTSKPKQTDTTQRWKISLKAEGLTAPLPTKIEFSRRKMSSEVSFDLVEPAIIQRYALYPVLVNHYVLQAGFIQKIEALINRTETQARDIFDLKLFIDQGAKIHALPYSLKNKIQTAIKNTRSLHFLEFKSQVLAFLMDEYQSYYHSDKSWHEIQEKVVATLQQALLV